MGDLVLLHVGCGGRYYEGFINTDKSDVNHRGEKIKVDLIHDLGKPWPFKDESVDGIVGMHVFIQLTWRELLVAFKEAYRVLKPGGVLRMGQPMAELTDHPLERLLGWNNINLFSLDLLKLVLVSHIGFKTFRRRGMHRSWLHPLDITDNRSERGTMYMEAVK